MRSHLAGEQKRGAHEEADGAATEADAVDDVVLVQRLHRVDGREPVKLDARKAVHHCKAQIPVSPTEP